MSIVGGEAGLSCPSPAPVASGFRGEKPHSASGRVCLLGSLPPMVPRGQTLPFAPWQAGHCARWPSGRAD